MISLSLTPLDDIQHVLNTYPADVELHLHLSPGVYNQKLRITHHKIHIYGSQTGETKISFGDYAYKMHTDGLLYNTFRTPTVMILSKEAYLYDLSIENSAGSGITIGQGIALTLYSLKTKLLRCKLYGAQDTLFIGPLPVDLTLRYDHFLPIEERHTYQSFHHFKDCYIEGDVDFIFGSGTAVFETSLIVAKGQGYIAAPSTYAQFDYGFIFYHSTIQSLTEDLVYLARPWRTHGATLFYQCHFVGTFARERYTDWDKEVYRFQEVPYVQSNFSSPMKEEEIEQLQYFLKVSL
jgi:pectinesterase